MIDSGSSGTLDHTEANQTSHSDGRLSELRSILLGPAESELVEINERLNDPQRRAQDISGVLPEALLIRSRKDNRIAEALEGPVGSAIQISVRRNPRALVDALFPVMGPAIRRAVSAALSEMVQSFNKTLENSFSIKGIKWRLEGLRTGKSFGEVALLHTLVYRVEQVFLIHRETGLLLQHAVSGAETVDPDMVSGMLRAIQDYMDDSFRTETGGETNFQRGDLKMWIAEGPLAVIAALVRGNAPEQLKIVLQETVEGIHFRQGDELRKFAGDSAPFEATLPLLEDCLRFHYRDGDAEKAAGRWPKPILIVLAILAAVLLLWAVHSLRATHRWNTYVANVKSQPGLVVTTAETQWGKYVIAGLRDPLAADPGKLLKDSGIEASDVESNWQPFIALNPEIVLDRAKEILHPPPSVVLSIDNGTLLATGSAGKGWIQKTNQIARLIPGVVSVETGALLEQHEEEIKSLKKQIEGTIVRFDLDSTQFVPHQELALAGLEAGLQKLANLSREDGKKILVEVLGHTDRSGTETRNTTLSLERAKALTSELQKSLSGQTNIDWDTIGTRDILRAEKSEEDKSFNRSDSIKLAVSEP